MGGGLLAPINLFIGKWSVCKSGRGVSEWFSVKVGLHQGRVMSSWLFNLFMDEVMKEFKASILQCE